MVLGCYPGKVQIPHLRQLGTGDLQMNLGSGAVNAVIKYIFTIGKQWKGQYIWIRNKEIRASNEGSKGPKEKKKEFRASKICLFGQILIRRNLLFSQELQVHFVCSSTVWGQDPKVSCPAPGKPRDSCGSCSFKPTRMDNLHSGVFS